MVVVNTNDIDTEVNLQNYRETIGLAEKIKNLKSNEEFEIANKKKIHIKRKTAEIFLLENEK